MTKKTAKDAKGKKLLLSVKKIRELGDSAAREVAGGGSNGNPDQSIHHGTACNPTLGYQK